MLWCALKFRPVWQCRACSPACPILPAADVVLMPAEPGSLQVEQLRLQPLGGLPGQLGHHSLLEQPARQPAVTCDPSVPPAGQVCCQACSATAI